MLDLKYTDLLMDECEQLCAIIAKSIITAKRKKSLQNTH